ncbi:MAG: isoprenyl transferase [Spirochaetes bacterium]|nr:MAG: isoprenyl transferase [Spirochaetota bacterium]
MVSDISFNDNGQHHKNYSENKNERKLPEHVAIIMDGNGRWAQKKGLPRSEGHREGAIRLREIIHASLEEGIRYLTVYAFSKENWNRPVTEVNSIMRLAEYFFRKEFNKLKKEGVFFKHLGDIYGLPDNIKRIIDEMHRNNAKERRLTLSIAFNYSGRSEIVSATRKIASLVADGKIKLEDINEELISNNLYTSGIPDPDLLIRTSGELRISNFLLWQSAYTEIWVTKTLWPDFSPRLYRKALEDYSKRDRKFGGINIYHSSVKQ